MSQFVFSRFLSCLITDVFVEHIFYKSSVFLMTWLLHAPVAWKDKEQGAALRIFRDLLGPAESKYFFVWLPSLGVF